MERQNGATRDLSISYLRVLAMVFIVFYHCVCYYGIWDEEFKDAFRYSSIETFRFFCMLALQLFVFISGFLYSNSRQNSWADLVKSKSKRLLIPYLFWVMVSSIIYPPLFNLNTIFSGCWHLWFLLMLLGVFLGAKALNVRKGSFAYVLSLIFMFSALSWVSTKFCPQSIVDLLAWRRVLGYMPFFLAGLMVSKFNIIERYKRLPTPIKLLLIVISLILLAVYHIRGGFPLSGLIIWLPICYLFVCLYVALSNVMLPDSLKNVVAKLDRDSMGIYLVHHILIFAILLYLPHVTEFMDAYPYVAPFVLFAIVFPISYLITELLLRNKITSVLMG